MIKHRITDYELYKKKFLSGTSLEKIGKEHKICAYRLGKALKEDGVVIAQNNQRHKYNIDFFKTIDSEEKAYWLGFLYADGYVGKSSKMELCLKYSDMDHLRKFRDVISPTLPIQPRVIRLKKREYKACRISFTNNIIKQQLGDLGCYNCKSHSLKFSRKIVDLKLMPHFIRGYFDGDGCIFKSGWTISGNKEFLTKLQEFIVALNIGHTAVKIYKDKRGAVHSLQKGTPRAALKFLDYIYNNCTIYLKRKYTLYNTLRQHLPQRAEMRVCKSRKKSGTPRKRTIRGEGPQ